MGESVAIIVGQLLGAGKMREARDTDNKMIAVAPKGISPTPPPLQTHKSNVRPGRYNGSAQRPAER